MGDLLNAGELQGVDPRLVDIVRRSVASLPYNAKISDGMRAGGKGNHKHGYAIDVQLIDPKTGNALPNKMYHPGTRNVIPGAVEAFPAYEQYAQTARVYQQQQYPELNDTFRWGGGFNQGGTPFDMMHLDITPGAHGAMAFYDWNTGLTPAGRTAQAGVVSNGGLGGYAGQQRAERYQQGLAGLLPPLDIPNVAPIPNRPSVQLAAQRDAGFPMPRPRPPMPAAPAPVIGRQTGLPLPPNFSYARNYPAAVPAANSTAQRVAAATSRGADDYAGSVMRFPLAPRPAPPAPAAPRTMTADAFNGTFNSLQPKPPTPAPPRQFTTAQLVQAANTVNGTHDLLGGRPPAPNGQLPSVVRTAAPQAGNVAMPPGARPAVVGTMGLTPPKAPNVPAPAYGGGYGLPPPSFGGVKPPVAPMPMPTIQRPMTPPPVVRPPVAPIPMGIPSFRQPMMAPMPMTSLQRTVAPIPYMPTQQLQAQRQSNPYTANGTQGRGSIQNSADDDAKFGRDSSGSAVNAGGSKASSKGTLHESGGFKYESNGDGTYRRVGTA